LEWLPKDSETAQRLTGLSVLGLNAVPVSPQENRKLFQGLIRTQRDPALAKFWQDLRQTRRSAKELRSRLDDTNFVGTIDRLPLAEWVRANPSHFKSEEARQELKAIPPTLAKECCARGDRYYETKDHVNALYWFNRAISIDPMYALAYAARGLVHQSQTNSASSSAEADFQKCRELDTDGKAARHYYSQGQNLLEDNRPMEAVVRFNTAVKLNPLLGQAYASRGVAYLQLTNIQQANAEFAQAKELGPDASLSSLLLERANLLSEKNTNGLSLSYLTACISLNGSNVEAREARGDSYRRLQNLDNAVEDYTEAIRGSPKESFHLNILYNNRGNTFYEKGDFDRALTDYDEAIKINPTDAVLVCNRADAYLKKGNKTNALSDYNRAIEIQPKATYPRERRGLYYAGEQQWDKAIRDYDEAIRNQPEKFSLYNDRGEVYLLQGDWKAAIENYTEAINRAVTNAVYYANRGYAFGQKEDWPNAIQDYSRAVQLEPNNSHLYYSRGILYRNQRAWENALRDFSQAIRLAPTANDYVQRGRTYKLKGELENARADFAKALNISEEPKDDVTRGFAKALLGEFDEALEDFHRALEAKPGDVETMFCLARFYAIRAASYPKNEEGEKSQSADIEKALGILEEVTLKKGYTDWSRSASAMDFEILRNNDRFQRLVSPR
jgi:tetratricopeptide (TPR) repeat protein